MVLAHLQVLAEIARVDASLSTFVMVHASLAMLTIERMVGKISLPLSTRVLNRKKNRHLNEAVQALSALRAIKSGENPVAVVDYFICSRRHGSQCNTEERSQVLV